ncbi:MAG TPA: hypothetical protein VGY55_07385 [Pirellulales bacterium]|jgi:hypothetical protein|nr:hypothetical protein [Pirellulales bacterium]
MRRNLASAWFWIVIYLTAIGAIAIYTVHVRNQMLADAKGIAKDEQSWQDWREAASKQDGINGPVERVLPPSTEPPMLMLMRDHFGVILGASVVFPGIILGFLMLVARGVLMRAIDGRHPESIAMGDHPAA